MTGRSQWTAIEYTALPSGPVVFVDLTRIVLELDADIVPSIYVVRSLLSTYYEYRLSSNQAYLQDLQNQKNSAVEKFKNATKYNSTQQLLEKYGAEPSSLKAAESGSKPEKKTKPKGRRESAPNFGRTSFQPPSTANIPRPPSQSPHAPKSSHTEPNSPRALGPMPQGDLPTSTHGAEFAPDAEPTPAQYLADSGASNHWYDRVMDLLLGEDETKPINRLALICSRCRLVNGQAPPGVKQLEEVGRWRCGGCGGWNGETEEIKKILHETTESQPALDTPVEEETVVEGHDAAILHSDPVTSQLKSADDSANSSNS